MTEIEASDVSLGSETAKATLAKFTMAAAGFVGTILFARLLGPVGIGGYYLLLTVIGLSNRPMGGLSAAIQKRLSESGFPVGEALAVTTIAGVGWTILCTVVALLLSSELDAFVGFDDAWIPFAALLGVLNLFMIYQGALSATGRIGRSRWIDAVRSYLTLPLQLGMVWIGLGAAGLAYGEALATGILLVPLFHFASGYFERPKWKTVRSLWTYAKYSIPNRYLSRVYAELDLLILGILLTEAAAGNYGVAFRLSLPAMYIAMVASSGLFSRISNRLSRGEPIEHDIENTLSFTSLFAIPMLFGGAVLNEQLVVTLYGSDFAPAAGLLTGLLFYQLVRTQASPLEKIVEGLDRPSVITQVYVGLLAVNLIAGVGLTLWLGAVGVVIATGATEVIRYVSLIIYVNRELPGLSSVQFVPSTQLLSGIAMAALLFILEGTIRINSWFVLSVLVVMGAGVYFLVLFGISRKFRETLFGTLDDVYPAWRDLIRPG